MQFCLSLNYGRNLPLSQKIPLKKISYEILHALLVNSELQTLPTFGVEKFFLSNLEKCAKL